jgi:Rho GTPase-activating protein RGD1
VLADGQHLAPPDEPPRGLKAAVEAIDSRADFRLYMQNYAYAHGGHARGPRREGPPEAGFLPPLPALTPQASMSPPLSGLTSPPAPALGAAMPAPPPAPALGGTFGVDLAEQMARDNVDVPPLMEKCCAAIERHGLTTQGIYRLSGTRNKVEQLRMLLDRGALLDDVAGAADRARQIWTRSTSTRRSGRRT